MPQIEAPIISVIVPIYNANHYLESCVSSVLNQSFSNFELILINDGSTDDSKEICDRMCEEDGRVRVISYKNNRGVSYARNKGIDSATGKFLFFLDSDDMIHPELFRVGMQQAETSEPDMMMFQLFFSEEESVTAWESFCGNPLPVDWVSLSGDDLWTHWFKRMNRNYIGGKFFLRDAVSDLRFDETVDHFEDGLFNYSFLTNRPRKVLYTDSPGYFYRIRENSLWHTMQVEDLLLTMEIRHRIIDRELQEGREKNAIVEEQNRIRNSRIWYAENLREDKTGADEVKKILKEEKNNALFKKSSRSEKFFLFLSLNFPSLYNTLRSTRKRLTGK